MDTGFGSSEAQADSDAPSQRLLRATRRDQEPLHRLSADPAYARALSHLPRFGAADWLPVLLQGETGTGKTWFARELHAASPRASRSFLALNLGATDTSLASSALFGHEAGAFTGALKRHRGAFERAHAGSLFLDELGHASSTLQGMLLHAVERGEITPLGAERVLTVDSRLIAAIHRPASELVETGALMPDLWHRLGALTIRLPALRDRRIDIAPLARGIATRDALRCTGSQAAPQFTRELLRRLETAYWPGNVRQLESIVRRLLLSSEPGAALGVEIWEDVVAPSELESPSDGRLPTPPRARGSVRVTTEQVVDMVQQSRSPADAARRLGVDRATVGRHLAAARASARGQSRAIDD